MSQKASISSGPWPFDRALEQVAVFTATGSLAGLVAAALGRFEAPQLLLIAAFATGLYSWIVPRAPGVAGDRRPFVELALLVAVALFFRLLPFDYPIGGQDEGVYVNMAEFLARTHGLAPVDTTLAHLAEGTTRATYLADNFLTGAHVPGVYATELQAGGGRLEFQFYHVFAVWMALFIGVFGTGTGVYALTAMSIGSIVFFYRLAWAMVGPRLAWLAGLLLAVNPLHAFFSRFPVTEVPTLMFSAMAFSFIAQYVLAPAAERRPRWLVLGAVAMAMLFYTRISGFMYVPFLLLLGMGHALVDTDRVRARAVNLAIAAMLVAYGSSVAYGLAYARYYSYDIYVQSFSHLFGGHWLRSLVALACLACAAWLGVLWLGAAGQRRARGERWLRAAAGVVPPAFTLILLVLSVFRLYRLGFTTAYLDDPWFGQLWDIAGHHLTTLAHSSLLAASLYMFPPLLAAGLAAMAWRWRLWRVVATVCFMLGFLFYVGVMQFITPYQPYYARYLLSEFVPGAILLCVVVFSFVQRRRVRIAWQVLFATSVAYGCMLCIVQIGHRVGEHASESLASIRRWIGTDDVVLLDNARLTAAGIGVGILEMPLAYTSGLNVADISDKSLQDWHYLADMNDSFDTVWLLSTQEFAPDGFRAVAATRFSMADYAPSNLPPMRFGTRASTKLFLYALDRTPLRTDKLLTLDQVDPELVRFETGWGLAEPWGRWTTAPRASLSLVGLDTSAFQGVAAIELHLRGFVLNSSHKQSVEVSISGERVGHAAFADDAARATITIPLERYRAAGKDKVALDLAMPAAVSPASLGMSGDNRLIGVGLESVRFVGSRADQ